MEHRSYRSLGNVTPEEFARSLVAGVPSAPIPQGAGGQDGRTVGGDKQVKLAMLMSLGLSWKLVQSLGAGQWECRINQ